MDRTRFLVILSVRMDRPQLVETLRELSLPLKGDPPVTVTLFYRAADPVLGVARLRRAIVERATPRLNLLKLEPLREVGLRGDAAEALANPLRPAEARIRVLARHPTATGLYLGFTRARAGGEQDAARMEARLYQKGTGALLASFEQETRGLGFRLPGRTAAQRKALLAKLVDPLVLQLQPAAIRSLRRVGESAPQLRLRVLGFRSVAEQERFEQAFFRRNSPFERFTLAALAPRSVTYQGAYGGDRSQLAGRLRGEQVGGFRIRHVFWYNDTLEIDVERTARPTHAEPRLFPPETRPADVAQTLEDYFARYTELEVEDPHYAEVEDNGWLDRANALPFNATVYGFLDARSDGDVYIGEALAPGEKITLVWHRVGRTNLSPAIRLYDAEGALVHTFHPRSWLRYVYTVPQGQHRFYLEVADRFGHLKVDTGGYLSFHYLLKARRQSLAGNGGG